MKIKGRNSKVHVRSLTQPFYRFYGPLKAYNDQTWKPVEIEVMK